MKIQIKKLNNNAIIPTQGSTYSAGYDLYACLDENVDKIVIQPHTTEKIGTGLAIAIPNGKIVIQPHTTEKIGTGLAIAIPNGYFGAIFARSGISSKKGLRPANCVGVCDSDYRGEYIVALHNDTDNVQIVEQHERIAQLVVMPYLELDFEECKNLSETTRGANGFGSTGK